MKWTGLLALISSGLLAQPHLTNTAQTDLFVSLYWENLTVDSLEALEGIDLNEERTYTYNDGFYGETPFSLACTLPSPDLALINAMIARGALVQYVFRHGLPNTVLGRVLNAPYTSSTLRYQVVHCLLCHGARLIDGQGQFLFGPEVERLIVREENALVRFLNAQLYFQRNMRFFATNVLFDRLYLKTLTAADLAPLLTQYADVTDRPTQRGQWHVIESVVQLALAYDEPDMELIAQLLIAGARLDVSWITTRFSPFLSFHMDFLERILHLLDAEDLEILLIEAEKTERDQVLLLDLLHTELERTRSPSLAALAAGCWGS